MWLTPVATASRRTATAWVRSRRAEDARPGKLHRAIAHAAEDDVVGELEDAAGGAVGHVHISISNGGSWHSEASWPHLPTATLALEKVVAMAWDTEGTRRKLKEAATTEFAERGPDGTTMARIAERAGINKERLYKYFGDERLPVRDSAVDELEKLAAAVTPSRRRLRGDRRIRRPHLRLPRGPPRAGPPTAVGRPVRGGGGRGEPHRPL